MAKTLKEIANNSLFAHLWTFNAKNYFHGVSWSALFNSATPVDSGSDLWEDSYYAALGLKNTLNPSFGIRKGIFRYFLMISKVNEDVGYIVYDENTNELYCSYYDGTAEELTEKINTGKKGGRYIHMFGNDEKIKKAYISNGVGSSEAYTIGSGKGKHSASAYMFYQFLSLLFREKDPKVIESVSVIKSFIQKVVGGTNPTQDELTEASLYLTKLENDVYVKTALISGQAPNIPFDSFENELNAVDPGAVRIGSAQKTKAKSTTKISKIKKLSDYVKSEELFVEHTFNGDEDMVPKGYDDYVIDKETLNCALLINKMTQLPEVPVMNMLFTGEAGTGKSTAAQLIARMCNLPYRFMTMSADTTVADLLLNILPGKKANTFEHYESELVQAFRNGGIIEIQEVNTVRKPNVLTSLNAALDDLKELHLPNGEIIKRHKDCVVIFTANVGYEGTAPMNQALLSRCFWKVEYELPEDNELVKRLIDKSGIDAETAKKMVRVMKDLQKNLQEEGETNGICSFRELVAWAKATVLLDDVHIAATNTIVNSGTFDQDVRVILEQTIANYFS